MNLAIKGHSTRGQEVIEILEMLGGKNHFHMDGFTEEYIYYICGENNQIHSAICPTNQMVFTIEEFLKKYPYKIGDKVIAYAEECIACFTIQDIRWNNKLNKIEYKICSSWYDTSLMQPYKEETMENKLDLLQQLKEYFNNTPREVIEKEWHGKMN